MQYQTITRSVAATAATVLGAALAEAQPVDKAALDKAFATLKTFDYGGSDNKVREQLGAIEDAVPACHGDEALCKDLETRLLAVLCADVPYAAKDYVCRKLTVIGTAASVPALAALLPDKKFSHLARYALERIPAAEAGKALREGLGKTSGAEKAGVAGSLGNRRDSEAVAPLAALVGDSDVSIALAAATALGDIGTAESAKALQEAKPASEAAKMRAADARLAAGEALLATGDKAAAQAVYKSLIACPVKSIRLAATRGLLLASGK